jgi:N-acetyltransferase B complex (NatB) non catalytic subunit
MQYSPYNADLKICAMFVYSDLHAASRSWELYHELYIKHIQNESCAYLILPLLRSGGLYRETIMVCQEIIGLQRTSGREAADFTARAMESGAVSKAEEFLVFHRERMTKSLTTLEAKGLILDAAPMLVQENEGVLGSAHGIVGGEADLERAKQMVAEAHNANGAFSLLQLRGPVEAHLKQVSENRDFGVLSYEILIKREFDTPNQILSESIRRCHQHSLLLRAALCIDAAKGPKKGKATKTSPELDKRCKSLLKSVDYAAESVDFQPAGCVKLLQAMREMCLAIVALSAGISSEGEPIFDNLDSREEAVVVALTSACESVHAAQREILNTNDLTVSRASRLLPDSIAPLFALFQMCAKLTDLFGWSRRKRKTKRCAAAVAAFALSFASLIGDMKSCLDG